MNYRVRLLARAETDLDHIYLWLAERSPVGAGRWYEAFLEACALLEQNARRFPLAAECREIEAEIREFFFRTRRGRRYRGLFTIVGGEARILRIRGPGQPLVRRDDL